MTDPQAIRQLIASYAFAIDAKDYDGIAACFWPDATFTYEHRPFTGHAEIVTLMKNAVEPLDGTQHIFTNFIIHFDGDTARVTFDGLAQHWHRGTVGGDTFMAGGKYKVQVRRVLGHWKIARASASAVWSAGNPALFEHTG
jgi:uncharacterized protein (TIGR02246 family)